MADPQFYLDKVLEVSTSERPAVLDWNGGVNEATIGAPPAPSGKKLKVIQAAIAASYGGY